MTKIKVYKNGKIKVAEKKEPQDKQQTKANNEEANDNQYVGYKNPPKHTQFKPGKSGNPAGRPKNVRNLETDIKELMDQEVIVTEGGKTKKVTRRMVLLKSLFAKGAQGNVSAAEKLLKLDGRYVSVKGEELELTDDDLGLLDSYAARKGSA